MADNIPVSGSILAFDEVSIGGVTAKVARNKFGFGGDGTYTEVSTDNPMPVALSSAITVTPEPAASYAMTAVPTGSGIQQLTGKPTGATGIEFFVDDGETITFTIAASAPSGTPPSFTLTGPVYLPLVLASDQQAYKVGTVTGTPAYRFV